MAGTLAQAFGTDLAEEDVVKRRFSGMDETSGGDDLAAAADELVGHRQGTRRSIGPEVDAERRRSAVRGEDAVFEGGVPAQGVKPQDAARLELELFRPLAVDLGLETDAHGEGGGRLELEEPAVHRPDDAPRLPLPGHGERLHEGPAVVPPDEDRVAGRGNVRGLAGGLGGLGGLGGIRCLEGDGLELEAYPHELLGQADRDPASSGHDEPRPPWTAGGLDVFEVFVAQEIELARLIIRAEGRHGRPEMAHQVEALAFGKKLVGIDVITRHLAPVARGETEPAAAQFALLELLASKHPDHRPRDRSRRRRRLGASKIGLGIDLGIDLDEAQPEARGAGELFAEGEPKGAGVQGHGFRLEIETGIHQLPLPVDRRRPDIAAQAGPMMVDHRLAEGLAAVHELVFEGVAKFVLAFLPALDCRRHLRCDLGV